MKSSFELHWHFSASNEIKMKGFLFLPLSQHLEEHQRLSKILNICHFSPDSRCSLHPWTLVSCSTLRSPESNKNALEKKINY